MNPNYKRQIVKLFACIGVTILFISCPNPVSDDEIKVSSVTLDKTNETLLVGTTLQLTATITPTNATNKSVTWSSSNSTVATVNSSGLVTAVNAGTATITVTTVDSGKTATCTVTVNPQAVPVETVILDKTSETLLAGTTLQLTATITPTNATNTSVTWSSSNSTVATVNSSGLVTAVNAGTATITVTTVDGGKTATCTVTVNPQAVPVETVTLDKTSETLLVGTTLQLTATITPANATNKSVTWSSSNSTVATVNSSGLVTAAGVGTATITVTTVDGGKTASCTVTIYNVTGDRVFNASNITNNTTYQIGAVKKAEGTYSIVYVDSQVSNSVSASAATAICNEFDTKIYNLIRTNFATESDVDGNGKIILLLLDIQDGYDPNTNPGYVAGYFDPTDLFSKTTYSTSNEADMIYLDVNPAEVASNEFYSTIAHEFQHLVNFNRTYLTRNINQDVWINEGLSSGAEYLYNGSHIQSRIDYYIADPMQTIQYGNNFFVWNGYWETIKGDVLADYSTVYLFFQWLRIHASNNSGIYKAILDSTYGDYRAVTASASLYINSQFGTWRNLLQTWLLAPLIQDPSGYMGYKGEINVNAWYFDSNGGYKYQFSPGEGIFTLTASGSHTPSSYGTSGTNIKYVGISANPLSFDTIGPDYSGNIVLTFNANTNCNGLDEFGYLSNTLTKLSAYQGLFNTTSKPYAIPAKYPVSILKNPGGNIKAESHKTGKNNLRDLTGLTLSKKVVKISE